MKVHAYVLAGDPAWVAESISSYYAAVDRIVVSYDRTFHSWTGQPMSVAEALRRIAMADPEGKVVPLPGDHVFPERSTVRNETEQRQAALDAASDGADWVLQLDTDEIVTSLPTLGRQLLAADAHAADALDFPLRDIYARVDSRRFLEHCGRFWRTQAAYPGPIAVRAGARLTVNRQTGAAPRFRVDVTAWNTDPAHPFDAPVHDVVAPDEAILHMSWVRSEAQMQEKRIVSGYASERDWSRDLARWRWRARHPWLTAATAPLARDPFNRFRITSLPQLVGAQP